MQAFRYMRPNKDIQAHNEGAPNWGAPKNPYERRRAGRGVSVEEVFEGMVEEIAEELRPISVLRFWTSEGLTQAES